MVPSLTRRVGWLLSLWCFPICHTTRSFSFVRIVLTSAYLRHYPEHWLFKQSYHQGRYGLDAYSPYRPSVRLPLMIASFLLFVFRCCRCTLSARLLVEWRSTRYEKLILFIIPVWASLIFRVGLVSFRTVPTCVRFTRLVRRASHHDSLLGVSRERTSL